MSQHTLTRISNVLDKHFTGLIDMADWATRPEPQRRTAFLSKAVAALCIKTLAGVDPAAAARAVTDGYHDNGLDAIYFDQKNDKFFLVQSKWSADGTKPLDADDAGTFVTGVKDLLSAKFERFNDKVRKKESEVTAALYSERPIKFVLVTAHTATQKIADHARRKIDDLISELNDAVPTAEGVNFDQAGVYGLITTESEAPKIKLQIGMKDWGAIKRPFLAYYGRVHVSEIAQWWKEHGNALFSHNLRLFYYSSDVNNALSKTLASEPEHFWYFNNGITVICDTLNKSAVGSPGQSVGVFTCEGANIVNGAQTVGTIGNSFGPLATGADGDNPESWVQVRIISLQHCPPGFSRHITRATNLQNAVGNREFAGMDPVQHRLATDFALDRRKYVYKQGEPIPKGDEGCDIVEATQALACAHSATLAVQVKREIGTLWADTEAPPYTDLFHAELSSTTVWRCVLVLRAVDEELQSLRATNMFGADLIGIHLNRVLLHLVFQQTAVKQLRHDNADEKSCFEAARAAIKAIFPRVSDYIREAHPDKYLASFSKNFTRCEELVSALQTGGRLKQGDLF